MSFSACVVVDVLRWILTPPPTADCRRCTDGTAAVAESRPTPSSSPASSHDAVAHPPYSPARAAHAYGIKNVAALAFYASAGPALVTLYASREKVGAARRVFGYMDGLDVVS
jgi:hypothetical protein